MTDRTEQNADPDVRPAVVDDAAAIAACHLACWRETYRGLIPDRVLDRSDLADRVAMWRDALTGPSPGRSIAVAEAAGEVVGFAAARAVDDPGHPRPLELNTLYVRLGHQGAGVGRALLDAVIAARPCLLWVAEDNIRSIEFYRRQGFVPDGTRQVFEDWGGLVVIRMVR